ncbi:MAG TPA: amino acid adenylation domain-containing protein, partial [Polyangiaceae bacterium]|nr:amino acid adenylation domain-containing protein [Polyangiaceae bacterium]
MSESFQAAELSSLVEMLKLRVRERPDQLCFRFLTSGDVDGPHEEWTYAMLDAKARAVAFELASVAAKGQRALLVYAPGLDFIAAFLGCAYAGVVAVPVYPPDPTRLDRTLPRLRAIAAHSESTLLLTTSAILQMRGMVTPLAPELASARWIATDTVGEALNADFEHAIGADTLAFLQYTSGSTGQPKGVMITHGNLLDNQRRIARAFGTDASTHVVGWLPVFHDMGLIGNVLHPLFLGASCTLLSPIAFLQRPLRWLEAISRFRGTTSGGPNFAYDLCARKVRPEELARLDLSTWTVAFNGAEPVRKETLDRFSATFARAGFQARAAYPCYGLAEATLFVSGGAHDAPPGHLNLSTHALARNIVEESSREGQDTRLVVSTGHHHPEVCLVVDPVTRMRCPADAVGEIWVSGASVAKGYWNDPEETAATFEARLSGTDDPRTFLRTGDLGFMTRGELFVTGRLKDLIILRGRNLYPQDVELTVERAHLAVRPGCVAAFAIDAGGQEQLAVLAEADLRAGQAEPGAVVAAIRRHVADEHGARASTVVLLKPRTIPKTSSGKIQRRASRAALIAGELEVIFSSSAEDTEEAAAPAVEAAPPPLHVALAASYAELRRSAIREFVQKHVAKALGVDASAVDLAVTPAAAGLDSLMMLELQDAAERELGTSVPSMLLWQCQSLTEFAEQLASGGVETERVAAEDAAIDADGALSSGQRRLWFLAQLNPGSAAYNVHFGFRIHGPIDAHLLQLALHELAKRCEQLRTIFVDLDGEPRSVVQQEGTIPLVGIDLGTSDPARLAELSAELSAQPFTLSTGPLTRAHLVATARDQHVLLLTQHHIVTDGWSAAMLGAELVAIYAALAGRLPLPIFRREPFTTFVRRERAQSEAQRDQHVFWRRTLAELPRLELPADRPVPARRTEHGGRVPLPLPRNTVDSLLKFGRARGCTPFVTLLSVYQLLLFRYTGQEDFAVGSVCANRNRSKARSIVGLLANTIALRCDLAGAPSFDELLQRTRTRVAAALENCELPFAEVVSAADVPRDRDENPIFQASFVLETVSSTVADAGGVTWEPFSFTPDGSVPSTSKFDLSFTLAERDQTFSGMIEYSRDRFDSETVERMAAHWHTLLDSVAQNPTRRLFEFELLPTAERRLVVSEQETTLPETDVGRCFHQLFEEQALATPDALAIAGSGPALTYAELNRRSNRLASHLRRRGVGPDAIVGLLLPRSSHFLAAMLAVFKAGGAYLPLDPEHTGERNLRVLRLSGARHLIATRELLASLPTDETAALGSIECFAIEDCDSLDEASDNLPPLNVPGHLAYVIYTSGSTGLPKGAMVEHAGMLNHLRSKLSVLDLHAGDVLAQTASQSFDISVWQFLAPLLVGGRVQVYSTTVASDPFRLFREVAADQVTILEVVPSLLRAALDDLDSNVGVSEGASVLRWLMLTGEALPPDLARTWLVRNPSVPIINAYGPTECSDDVTHHIIRDPAELNGVHTPIGRAIQNCRLYVLDRAMQPVPLGVAGELYIGGVCVGRGYLHDPARTAQAFVPDPLGGGSGDRLYCTGDRVIRRPNGELEFLGRSDYQVKVRGYRIELGEIESVLEEQVGVSQAVVVARGFGGGDKRLVGYVVLSGGVSSVELRRVLRQRLPEYMVPTWLVELDSLPLTSNGKVDRRALPEPKEREVDAGDWEGLSSPVTELLSQIWSE